MIKAIILTLIILIVIYIFLFRTTRNRKKKDFDSVAEYHDLYIEKNSLNSYRGAYSTKKNSTNDSRGYSIYSYDSGHETNKYVTKFNSNEDYREK